MSTKPPKEYKESKHEHVVKKGNTFVKQHSCSFKLNVSDGDVDEDDDEEDDDEVHKFVRAPYQNKTLKLKISNLSLAVFRSIRVSRCCSTKLSLLNLSSGFEMDRKKEEALVATEVETGGSEVMRSTASAFEDADEVDYDDDYYGESDGESGDPLSSDEEEDKEDLLAEKQFIKAPIRSRKSTKSAIKERRDAT
ncbi:hypothetical protein YC2023_058800 [Brassica napus]